MIETGNDLILVDAGSGVVHRLLEAGYDRPALRRIALTHLHSDHLMGLPDLLWTGWIMRWWEQPPPIAGPPGTAALIDGLLQAFADDVAIRTRGERLERDWLVPAVVEVDDGWQEEGDGWRLTSFRVDHEPVDEAFGYRLDADGGSLAISGDTRPSENLIRHTRGVDLLVHEVYWRAGALARRAAATDPAAIARMDVVDDYHTHSEDVGKLAARAEAGHLVLSHILFRGGSPEAIQSDIEPDFPRAITVGADLQTFRIGGP